MVFRVLKTSRRARKALVNPARSGDPISGRMGEYQSGSGSRKFADVSQLLLKPCLEQGGLSIFNGLDLVLRDGE
jgi:hypothetical protein